MRSTNFLQNLLFLGIFFTLLTGASNLYASEAFIWTNAINVSVTGNTIQKTGGCEGCANAGAVSQQSINGDGFIEFTTTSNQYTFVGFGSNTTNSTSLNDITFGFTITPNGGWDIREQNYTYRTDGTYIVGDVFKISAENNQIKYYKNGSLVYTSGLTPSFPLVMDSSILNIGGRVSNAIISSTTPPTGGCVANVKTDRGIYPEPALPILPSAGGKFCDPTFGTEIMRVTDQNDGNAYGTEYAYYPTFNSNNSQLYVFGASGGSFVVNFDPQNFVLLGNKRFLPSGVYESSVTWSNSLPNILYGVAGAGGAGAILYQINTDTMTKTVVKNFAGEPNFSPGDYLVQMSMSENEDVFAFTHKNSSYADVGHIAYKRSTNQLLYNSNSPNMNGERVDEVQIDKSGRYLGIPLGSTDSLGNEYYVKDTQTGTLVGLTDGAPDFAPGHGDFGTSINVAYENWNNRVLRRNLSTPHSFFSVLDFFNDWTLGFHMSMRGIDENWALASTYTVNGCISRIGVLHDEIFLFSTDGFQSLRRLAHTRTILSECINGQSANSTYYRTARANISRDGKYVAFTSSWGIANPNARTDLFIVRVPQTTPPPSSSNVVWQNIQSTTVNGNNVSHNRTSYFATARSQQQINSGASYFEFTFDGKKDTWAGLSKTTSAIDFSFVFSDSTSFGIFESGVYKGEGTAQTGDVFRVEITSTGDVIYKKNGNLISISRTNNPTLSYPYYLVFKAQDEPPYNQSISNAKFGGQ